MWRKLKFLFQICIYTEDRKIRVQRTPWKEEVAFSRLSHVLFENACCLEAQATPTVSAEAPPLELQKAQRWPASARPLGLCWSVPFWLRRTVTLMFQVSCGSDSSIQQREYTRKHETCKNIRSFRHRKKVKHSFVEDVAFSKPLELLSLPVRSKCYTEPGVLCHDYPYFKVLQEEFSGRKA